MRPKKTRPEKHPTIKNTSFAEPLTKKKVWLYRLVCLLLIPVLFFFTLELALRCFGYGYSPHAIVKYNLEDKEVYCHNYKFGWRFFPRITARSFDGFAFDTHKSPKSYRIFVLGASAAMGTPAPSYNFGRMLEVMLDELYPDTDFEVHTVAMAAINSHVVVEIAKDCAKHQPDLFVVYLGNNEIVGPFGPGTVFAPLSPNLSLIRANIAFKSTRIGQFLDRIMYSIAPPQQWSGPQMFLDKQVRYNDPALQIAYQHFEENLRDICRIGLDAGAKVIVSNVPSNLKDCPPFASLHRTDLTEPEKQAWQQLYEKGISYETEGQYEQAIAQYLDAEKIDTEFADLEFRLGNCFWNTGDYQKAKEKYIKARKYDTLRFRADNRINDIIRTVTDSGVQDDFYFADSIGVFEANSPHEIPDAALFYEHVHMKFKGNYLLARSLLDPIQKILPAEWQPVTADDFSEKDLENYLAYTAYERMGYLKLMHQSFMSKSPFTNQLFHEQRSADTEKQIDSLLQRFQEIGPNACMIEHQQAIQNRPDDWQLLLQYAGFLNHGLDDAPELYDIKEEETVLRKVIQRCPYNLAYVMLGKNLIRQGRIEEAQSVLNDLVDLNPNEVRGHIELASIYRQRGDYPKEIQHLLEALSLQSSRTIEPYINLADAYDKTGKTNLAIGILNDVLTYFPEEQTAPAHTLLAYLLYAQGDYEKALKEMQHAFKIDPDMKNNPSLNSFLIQLTNQPKR